MINLSEVNKSLALKLMLVHVFIIALSNYIVQFPLEIFGIKDENLRGILEEFWINLERFAALVAAREREACAKVCDVIDDGREDLSAECAEAIRARGEA